MRGQQDDSRVVASYKFGRGGIRIRSVTPIRVVATRSEEVRFLNEWFGERLIFVFEAEGAQRLAYGC